eukprot:764657-Hanusia_phi.AAC.4
MEKFPMTRRRRKRVVAPLPLRPCDEVVDVHTVALTPPVQPVFCLSAPGDVWRQLDEDSCAGYAQIYSLAARCHADESNFDVLTTTELVEEVDSVPAACLPVHPDVGDIVELQKPLELIHNSPVMRKHNDLRRAARADCRMLQPLLCRVQLRQAYELVHRARHQEALLRSCLALLQASVPFAGAVDGSIDEGSSLGRQLLHDVFLQPPQHHALRKEQVQLVRPPAPSDRVEGKPDDVAERLGKLEPAGAKEAAMERV